MAKGPEVMAERSIAWGVQVNDGFNQPEVLTLRRGALLDSVQSASSICTSALVNRFKLSKQAEYGIVRAKEGAKSWVVYGNEGPVEDQMDLIGTLSSVDVVDIQTRRPITSVRRSGSPEIRISVEGISQEATNLRLTAEDLALAGSDLEVGTRTMAMVDRLINDNDLLVRAASRVAAARRIVRYVLLPSDALSPEDLQVGFETWYEEQFSKSRSNKPTKKQLEDIKADYQESDLPIKNLRRTAWVPIFFDSLGIDPNDLAFYMRYRQQVGQNGGYTVTFNSPLTTLLKHDETKAALERTFNPEARTRTKFTVV